ncbi:hydrolase [Tupanvirus soda lake]|uniref:Hydrolase n=2 Tax=Tupanvirus TaxID=2094720 RepID=A0A6N1NJG3_9VIRU|nr:hydrolase [Tupanvirus soda lake]QKU34969.1 hydrolase [Tupanvirus soda lake]
MASIVKDKDYFVSSPLMFIENDKEKTLSIPIRNPNHHRSDSISKSWNGQNYMEKPKKDRKNYSTSPTSQNFDIKKYKRNRNEPDNFVNDLYDMSFKPYDAIANCKSAGIIPYTIIDGEVHFLLQEAQNPLRKKDSGWNDFGGKKINPNETTAETAAREFSEETSCLFYLKEQNTEECDKYFDILKDNEDLEYDNETIKILKNLIPLSQKYYADKITEFVLPVYISSKETYISYFVKVEYISEDYLPKAEDIHIPYENRYIRNCKWFSFDELMALDEKDFHKRLQITRIQQRIQNYYEKGLFT